VLQVLLLELLRQRLVLLELLLGLLEPQLLELLQEQEEHLFCHKQLKR